jgi:hypothetical protein
MPSLGIQKGELNSRSYLPIIISPDPPNRIRWENDNMDFSSDLLKHTLFQGICTDTTFLSRALTTKFPYSVGLVPCLSLRVCSLQGDVNARRQTK